MTVKRATIAFVISEGAILLLSWLWALRSHWQFQRYERSIFFVAAVVAGGALFAIAGSGSGPVDMPSPGVGSAGRVGYVTALTAHPDGVQEAFKRERTVGRFNFGYPVVVLVAAVVAMGVSALVHNL